MLPLPQSEKEAMGGEEDGVACLPEDKGNNQWTENYK
jgi:hypothetical protein